FFRTTVRSYETIRAHILYRLYGFRLPRDFLTSDPGIKDEVDLKKTGNRAPIIESPLSSLNWLNFSSPLDPISAPLGFFQKVSEHRLWYLFPGFCHTSYWHDSKFYKAVADALFCKDSHTSEKQSDLGSFAAKGSSR